MAEKITNLATYENQQSIQAAVDEIKAKVNELAEKWCDIVVTCATTDGVTVTGQTVTLHAGSSADDPVYDTRAYNGQPVTFQVPAGFRYFVRVSSTLAGHYGPTTAVGTASATTIAVTLTYSDINNITTFAGIKDAVNSFSDVAEGKAALVGIEIADTWTADDGVTVYQNPMVCVDVQERLDANNEPHLAAVMMRKYATVNAMQFDAPEREEATEETALTGVYYFGWIESTNAFTALKLSAGATIPYGNYDKVFRNTIHQTNLDVLKYGWNNWEYSSYRQYLNSDAAVGEWYYSTHIGQCEPDNAAVTRGWKAGCSAELLAHAKPVQVPCWANTTTDGGKIYTTLDTFWLPSGTEMYGAVNENEGSAFEYVVEATGLESAANGNNTGRVYRKENATSTATIYRLRSAHRGSSYYAWCVHAAGSVNTNSASSAYAGVPACCIF